MRVSREEHKTEMSRRKGRRERLVSDVNPASYNTSKYWPNECKSQGKR